MSDHKRGESFKISRQSEQCPCKGCQTRAPTCHSCCGRYADWRTEYDRIEANRRNYMRSRSHGDWPGRVEKKYD